MTLGNYNNFSLNIHGTESFTSTLSSRKLQEILIETFHAINRKEFSFEDVSIPTVPDGKVIFEFALADDENLNFNYVDREEVKKALDLLSKARLDTLDFFCAIRYYKVKGEKKRALKFDYYLLRIVFGKDLFEIQVFHLRGPRYISPQELIDFVFSEIYQLYPKKIQKAPSF